MTRNEAKQNTWKAHCNFDDPRKAIHIVIDQIFNDHEAQLKALYFQITELKMMEEDAQQFALRCSKELKAKDEEIERLKVELKHYKELASDLDNELRNVQWELSDLKDTK